MVGGVAPAVVVDGIADDAVAVNAIVTVVDLNDVVILRR